LQSNTKYFSPKIGTKATKDFHDRILGFKLELANLSKFTSPKNWDSDPTEVSKRTLNLKKLR